MDLKEKLRLKTANPASAAPVKLAFLGDSVTHGCFEIIEKAAGCFDCVYDQDAVYHNRLRRQLAAVFPNCPATIINAGISGGSAQQGAERVRRDVIEAGPDLAVVCFGLNDALQPDGLEGYRKGLSSIFRQLKEAGIQTLFMTPNMMCTAVSPQIPAGWQRETGEACAAVQCGGTMDRFMDEARALCAREKVPVCDCYADWKRLEALGADIPCLLSNHINHPTREMHALFAARLFEAIIL